MVAGVHFMSSYVVSIRLWYKPVTGNFTLMTSQIPPKPHASSNVRVIIQTIPKLYMELKIKKVVLDLFTITVANSHYEQNSNIYINIYKYKDDTSTVIKMYWRICHSLDKFRQINTFSSST